MPWRPFDDDWPPPSRPLPAKGGIRAHSQRGSFAGSWWGSRWISVLESLQIGGRLGRGRSYARAGQVLEIEIEEGVVQARVQGSRPSPYGVTVKVKPLAGKQWRNILDALSGQAGFSARLLAGEMPRDIEQVFRDAGTSLFPASYRDFHTRCTCPDPANPCKHIAAVYYLIGEEFDRDPFLIFRLRGLSREALVASLSSAADADAGAAPSEAVAESTPIEPHRFWNPPVVTPDFFGDIASSTTPEAMLQRLGRFPFWRGAAPIESTLAPAYREAVQRGLAVYLGSEEPGSEEPDDSP